MTVLPEWLEQKVAGAELAAKENQQKPLPVAPMQEATYGHEGKVNLSRVLAKAAHGLNMSQKRLVMYAISKLHPHAPQSPQFIVRVNALDYAEEMKVRENNAYRDLKEASEGLFDRYVTIAHDTPTGRKIQRIHWVSSSTYHTGEGWVELRFTAEVSPFLSQLKEGNQVIYQLQKAINLKSLYAWRLLELLMQWKDTQRLYIKLDDFRHALEVPETYRYTDIRINCIEKPIEELRKKSGLDITWKAIKDKENKRRVGSLGFSWKNVEQLEMKLKGGKAEKKQSTK